MEENAETGCSGSVGNHRFPVFETEVFNKWVERVRHPKFATLDDLQIHKLYRVCNEHFIDECKNSGTRRLKKYAVPSKNLPGFNEEPSEDNSFLYPVYLKIKDITSAIEVDHNYATFLRSTAATEKSSNVEDGFQVEIGSSSTEKTTDAVDEYQVEMDHCYIGSTVADENSMETVSILKRSYEFEDHIENNNDIPHILTTPRNKKSRMTTKYGSRRNLLNEVGLSRKRDLSPRARYLFNVATNLQKHTKRQYNRSFKQRLQRAQKMGDSEVFQKMMDNVNNTTFQFFLSQMRLQKKKPRARRFSMDDKIFALSLLKHGRRSYKLLSKIFALPSRQTVMEILHKVPFLPGVNHRIMQHLKKSVSKLKKRCHRYCTIMFDEVALTAHLDYSIHKDVIFGFEDLGTGYRKPAFATHAIVFMVRGIIRNFKQPVAFMLCANATNKFQLARIIKEVVRSVEETGLKVVATVSDQGTNNVGAINILKENTVADYARRGEEKTNLGYEINGKEILHIYDVPHLLKCVRNNLLTKNIVFVENGTTKVANWNHLIQFYGIDQGKSEMRMCPQLTDQHVLPNKIKKMKVCLAAQAMSQRVSSIMRKLVELSIDKNTLDSAATDTADFFIFIDQLFDSCNGSLKTPTRGKLLQCAVSRNSAHEEFWRGAIKILDSIHYVCPKTNKKMQLLTVKNWKANLQNFIYIKNKLFSSSQKTLEYISLRNFNQDPVENFFGCIRSHGVRNTNPTPYSFISSFKSLIITNFMASHSVNANCQIDETIGALDDLKSFIIHAIPSEPESSVSLTSVPDCHPDSPTPIDKEAHCYVAGYIVKRFADKLKCQICISNIRDNEKCTVVQAVERAGCTMHNANAGFTDFFIKVLGMFERNICKFCYQINVGQQLKNVSSSIHTEIFTCPKHNAKDIALGIIIDFCIITWTRNVNKILMGKNRYIYKDPIKKLALHYFDTHRTRRS